MTKTLTYIALAAALLTGCKKKDTGSGSGGTTSTATASMTANVGGKSFSTGGIMITADVQASGMNITGSIASTKEAIILSIENQAPATGTYPINNHTIASYAQGLDGKAAVYGSIIVTSISPRWEGTFSFTCSDSTKVTDGKFSVTAPK